MPAVLLGVISALTWSIHDIMGRRLAARVGPFRMGLFVMLGGAVLLSVAIWPAGGVSGLTRHGALLAVAMGVGYGLGAAGLFKAFSMAPLSIVGPITSAYPVLVVLWGLFGGFYPSLLQWLAIGATLVGAIVVGRAGPEHAGLDAIAPGRLPALLFYCALCSVGYAAAVVLGQDATPEIGELQTAWLARPASLITLLPFVMSEARPAKLNLNHWVAMLSMAVLDIAGLLAVNASGRLPDKEFAAIGISAYGAIATLLAAVFLKEKVTLGQWLGVALIAGGVAALTIAG